MMVRGLVGALAWASLGGVWWSRAETFWRPHAVAAAQERWRGADALEVEVGGVWREVRLVPLAGHLCRAHSPLFDRYCAPGRP